MKSLWFSRESSSKCAKKRKAEEPEDLISSKRVLREETIDKMTQELREKHDEQFSGPQLRLWASMKLNGQHYSMEHPPQIPLFAGTMTRKPKRESLSDALTNAATAVVGILKGQPPSTSGNSMSPGKRARVSGQYLEHLEKIKQLHESGVLCKDEFQEQKQYALNNIKGLNKK